MPIEEDSLFQDKYKAPATPLTTIKNPIDQLDTILNILDNDDDWKPHTFRHIRHYVLNKKISISDKDLELAIEKLCDDKYVSIVHDYDGRSPADKFLNVPIPDKYFRITYLGRVFISKVPKQYTGRPYRNQISDERRKNVYTQAKIVLNVASTLIIIIIGAMGVYVTDKSNKLEVTVDEMKQKIEKKDFSFDSLIKLTKDTIKFKAK